MSENTADDQLTRRGFLSLTGAAALGVVTDSLLRAAGTDGERKPNIVLIVADDLGYADVGFHGCKDIPTPHIDSIASKGVRFTNAYVSSPVCSPTRAGLMTGRYQQRFGHELLTGSPANSQAEHIGLPLTERTIADVLKSAGYVTGAVGKWHLGMHRKYHPNRRGFDEFFGFLYSGNSYLRPGKNKFNPLLKGNKRVSETAYLTDAFTREATGFIERHRADPFFLYLAYNAPHTPMQATQKYLKRFAHIRDEKRRTYAAMVAALDDGIGAVLGKLNEHHLQRNTLVIFLNDNGGGPKAFNESRNDPLREGKGTMYEGGLRVPFAMRWPGRIEAGKLYDHPITCLDILPTVAAAAGARLPADTTIDGVDLVPHVTDKKDLPPHDVLYWRYGQDRAVRKGNWKLVKTSQGAWLYDMAADISESKDLAGDKPKIVRELNEALAKWETGLVEPKWAPGPPRRVRKRRPQPSE